VRRSTVDANVLVYSTAVDSPFHSAADVLIRDLARGPDLVYLFWPVVMAYLRIATNPVIARTPLSATEAEANVTLLLEQPHIRVAGERESFWDTYVKLAHGVRPTANLVPDAHLVALMRENEVGTIWTHDRDFRKFDGIEVRDPFA
jgi:uncharacterized protein